MAENRCVCCGEIIPEGMMVCPNCLVTSKEEKRLYNAHEVAEIIAELFGDTCACNFNRIYEWLPFKCELQDACPNPVGVACWEQYLKYRGAENA